MSIRKFFKDNAATLALVVGGIGASVGVGVGVSPKAGATTAGVFAVAAVANEAEKKLKKKYPKGSLSKDLDSIGAVVEKAMGLGPVEGVIQEKAQILQVQNKSNRLKMENGNDAAVVFKNMSMPGGTSLN